MNKKVKHNFLTLRVIFFLTNKIFTALQLEESVSQNVSLQNKITQLENTLTTREQDLLACDAKYRKCVDKAKEVIKSLDPRLANGVLI